MAPPTQPSLVDVADNTLLPADALVPREKVAVFLSSSFADTIVDRTRLAHAVNPELREYCAARGLEWEPVDLRWGISEKEFTQGEVTSICMAEVERCRRESAGPFFCLLLTDRHGIPLAPSSISSDDWAALMGLKGATKDQRVILEKCYTRDDNAVPPVYIKTEHDPKLSVTLQRMGQLAFGKDPAKLALYSRSVTEQEVRQALSVDGDESRCIVAHRRLTGLLEASMQKDPSVGSFVVIDARSDAPNPTLQKYQTRLRDDVDARFPAKMQSPASLHWEAGGLDGKHASHAEYLDRFCEFFADQIKMAVDAIAARPPAVPPMYVSLARELALHGQIARSKALGFAGRAKERQALHQYLAGATKDNQGRILVVCGPPGVGKTALLCSAAAAAMAPRRPAAAAAAVAATPRAGASPAAAGSAPAAGSAAAAQVESGDVVGAMVAAASPGPTPSKKADKAAAAESSKPEIAKQLLLRIIGASPRSKSIRDLLECMCEQLALSKDLLRGGDGDDSDAALLDQTSKSLQATVLDDDAERKKAVLGPGHMAVQLQRQLLHTLAKSAGPSGAAVDTDGDVGTQGSADGSGGNKYDALIGMFHRLLAVQAESEAEASAKRRQLLVLDSIDQIAADDNARANLKWLPPASMVDDRLRVVVSTTPDNLDAVKHRYGEAMITISVGGMSKTDVESAVSALLAVKGRQLAEAQRELVLSKVTAHPYGLYLRLVVDESCRWRSFDASPKVTGDNTDEAIGGFFARVESFLAHGPVLVGAFMRMLLVSRDGLSIGEIADLLSCDPTVMSAIDQHNKTYKYSMPERRVPKILLQRLVGYFDGHFVQHQIDGIALMALHHPQVSQVSRTRYLGKGALQTARELLARYFLGELEQTADGVAPQPTWREAKPNVRKLRELPQVLIDAKMGRAFASTVCSLEFLEAAFAAGVGGDVAMQVIRAERAFRDERVIYECMRMLRESTQFLVNGSETVWQAAARLPARTRLYAQASVQGGILVDHRRMDTFTPLMSTFHGHTGTVTMVSFSSDGRWLASASEDQTVRIWSIEASELVHTLSGHTDAVTCCRFEPTRGGVVVSSSLDWSLMVWSRAAGVRRRVLVGHQAPVLTFCFEPKGSTVCSVSEDGTARIWAVATGECRVVLEGHTGPVQWCAFRPGSDQVCTAGTDGTLRLWRTEDGESTQVLEAHSSAINSFEFSREGNLIASCAEDRRVRVYDLGQTSKSGTGPKSVIAAKTHMGSVHQVKFSADARLVASCADDRTVVLRRVATAQVERSLVGHKLPVLSLDWSGDGTMLATSSKDRTVHIANAEGRVLSILSGHNGWVFDVSFSPDSSMLASASEDHTVRLWSMTEVQSFGSLDAVDDEAAEAEAAADGGKEAPPPPPAVQDMREEDTLAPPFEEPKGEDRPFESVLVELPHRKRVNRLTMSPDGRTMASCSHDKSIKLWDLQRDDPVATLEGHSWSVLHSRFSRDGALLVTSSRDGTARLWVVAERRCRHRYVGHEDFCVWADFNPEATKVVTASWDGSCRVWDAGNGLQYQKVQHDKAANCAAWAPRGSIIATASDDCTARTWNSSTGDPILVMQHDAPVAHLAFVAPEGVSHLATVTTDGTASLWDATTGAFLRSLKPHTAPLAGVPRVFSTPDLGVLTTSQDGSVVVTHLHPYAEERKRFVADQGEPVDAAISKDGTTVAVVYKDGAMRVWSGSDEPKWVPLNARGVCVVLHEPENGSSQVCVGCDDGHVGLYRLV